MREPHWSHCPEFSPANAWYVHYLVITFVWKVDAVRSGQPPHWGKGKNVQIWPRGADCASQSLSLSSLPPPPSPSPSPPLSFSLHLSCIILSDPHSTPILHIRKVKLHTWKMSMLRLSAPSMKTWIPGYQWLMGHSQRVSSQADIYSTYNWFHFLWQH